MQHSSTVCNAAGNDREGTAVCGKASSLLHTDVSHADNTGPHAVAPTMSARYGTGGNNVPLVSQEPDSFCIAGNIIDRQVKNGGNGLGCQEDIAYTLTATDHLSGCPDK